MGLRETLGAFFFAVPIGNWDLLEDTYISSYSNGFDTISIIDEENYWGFQTTTNLTYREDSRISIFSKIDGVLVFFQYKVTFDFGHTTSVSIERIAPPLNLNNPVLIAGVSIIFVGLLGVYFSRRLRSTTNQS